ncbi:MAG: hypothetical protein V2J24_02450 [Pseudomonadales bacterium]|jgi:hypothetical protein|nr:hypothetical protein [Pseudomonadales bacterium]
MTPGRRRARVIAAGLLGLALVGCAARDSAPGMGTDEAALRARSDFETCNEPRPEICTLEYVPVCALRRTELECGTEPCDAVFERVTKSNRCTACADGEVLGWIPGACDADPVESPLYLDP